MLLGAFFFLEEKIKDLHAHFPHHQGLWLDGGYVGIEYEGGLMRTMGGDMNYLTSDEGIRKTKALLEKVLQELG